MAHIGPAFRGASALITKLRAAELSDWRAGTVARRWPRNAPELGFHRKMPRQRPCGRASRSRTVRRHAINRKRRMGHVDPREPGWPAAGVELSPQACVALRVRQI